MQKQNVVKIRPGPTAYSVSLVNLNDPLSSLRILINEPMLRNVRKCTEAEAQRVTKNPNWTISLDDLEKFIGLIIGRGAIDGRNLPIKSMWESVWSFPLFDSTMPRNKFLEIVNTFVLTQKVKEEQIWSMINFVWHLPYGFLLMKIAKKRTFQTFLLL